MNQHNPWSRIVALQIAGRSVSSLTIADDNEPPPQPRLGIRKINTPRSEAVEAVAQEARRQKDNPRAFSGKPTDWYPV